ncbi:hypothetical protein HD806DRAFT_543060 [Xylariaceae sp. AK1471]|nr:hypothetical protein HD806DRAFT_543060 [Xylariaceae sp. AK1471]
MATQKSAARGALTSTSTKLTKTGLETETETEVATEVTSPYTQALARLSPLQPILLGIAHRNHNQHRRAAWWRHFRMLRRHCADLVEDLVSAIATSQKNAIRAAKVAKTKSKKRRREELLGAGAGVSGKDDDETGEKTEVGMKMEVDKNVARHATWLRDVLVPKCYLAFSQLTADNQFAPLGVVLLGVLAQIQAACECAAPRPVALPNAEDTAAIAEAGDIASEPRPKTGVSQTALEGKKEAGGGKAVSREALERAERLLKKGKEKGNARNDRNPHPHPQDAQPTRSNLVHPARQVLSTATTTVTTTTTTTSITIDRTAGAPPSEGAKATASISSDKRQILSVQEGADKVSRPTKKMKTALPAKEKDNEKGKRKKKAKKGDEFDDLFKGLF